MSVNPPIYKSLTFWTLLIGLVMFVVTFYVPAFPLSAGSVSALVLFVLGLIGVYPTLKARGLRSALAGGIVNVLAFWQLVAGFILFVITYFAPAFPFDNTTILSVILFVLSYFGIKPELRARFQ
jgi:uncharacterized membrane protein YqjE